MGWEAGRGPRQKVIEAIRGWKEEREVGGRGGVGDDSPLQVSSWRRGWRVFIRKRVSPGGRAHQQPVLLDADSAQLGREPKAGWQDTGPALGDFGRDGAGSTAN